MPEPRTLFHVCNIIILFDSTHSSSYAMGLKIDAKGMVDGFGDGRNNLKIIFYRNGAYPLAAPHLLILAFLFSIKTVKPQLFDRFISVFNQDQEDLVQRLTNMDTENRGLERELSRLQVFTIVKMHHKAF
jgi:hypothetical protein